MAEGDLVTELTEGRELIRQMPTRDLVHLLEVSPPLAYWSTILAYLIRTEFQRREWMDQ
jgi:hypothetical protein